MEQQYFFSYSRKDADFVIKLAGDLKKAGINVWVDKLDILPGARWDDSVEKGLRNAGGMLVVLSETSIQSENVMDEVSYALEKGKRVVPLLMQNCDIPFRWQDCNTLILQKTTPQLYNFLFKR